MANCTAAANVQCAPCQSLIFSTKPGTEDYGACAGTYILDSSKVNGQPVYTNVAGSRFLAYSAAGAGSAAGWVITGMQWLSEIAAVGGSFGGFQGNGNAQVLLSWASYQVTYPAQAASACASLWACPTGYFLSGAACRPCSTPACPVGQYSSLCTATADATCQACTGPGPNAVFIGAGLPGAPSSCPAVCAAGFRSNGTVCVACQVTFTTKPGVEDYGACAGVFSFASREINGQPVYINAAASRFLAYSAAGTGSAAGWVITGTQWLSEIAAAGGSFGGFQGNGNAQVLLGWASYTARMPAGC